MAPRTKTTPAKSLRQSVTLPATLAAQVRRVAKQDRLTMSRAIVALTERGIRAEAEAKAQLKSSYNRFLTESEPDKKNAAGRDLIRSIFGKDAIAEDSVL
jgi:hypothetical protein